MGGLGADFTFGNGGADTMVSGLSDDIVIAGFTSASVAADGGNNIIFGNEGDDTLAADVAPGRQYRVRRPGNDWVRMAAGAGGGDNLQANEGNDTIFGGGGVDTMAGGNGGDLFIYYRDTSDDGSSTGAVELITDLNSAADRIQTFTPVAFAFDTGPRGGTTLAPAANDAIEEAFGATATGTRTSRPSSPSTAARTSRSTRTRPTSCSTIRATCPSTSPEFRATNFT